MNKELILFDWDDTLFSKNKFINNLGENLSNNCGVDNEIILNLEKEYVSGLSKSGDFRLDGFLNYLEQKFNNKIELKDYLSDKLGIYSTSLFEDTVSVLSKLKNNFILGIYSQGFDDLQKIKIEASGIKQFFNEQYVYVNKDKLSPKAIEQLPNGATIVDDKREVVKNLKALNCFNLIWVNRKSEEQIPGVPMAKNLKEVVDLINS